MRILIAHAPTDREHARAIASEIGEAGHETTVFTLFNEYDDPKGTELFFELGNFDGCVVLLSAETSEEYYIQNIVEYFHKLRPDSSALLVNLDDSPQSRGIQRFRQLYGKDMTPESLGQKIVWLLTLSENERASEREAVEKRKEAVEKTSERYITESLKSLGSREQKYQMWSFICYGLGYLTILGGLFYALRRVLQDAPDFSNVSQSIYSSVLTLTVIGFLAASSRFAFVLGKSFIIESLRNHDRIHAIRFGEFYLKAFGENASWADIKEAFQHWNFDSGSNFKDQSDESIDPQVVKLFAEIVRKIKI